MKKQITTSLFVVCFALTSMALQLPTDSVKAEKRSKPYSTTLTLRLHTMGFFSFTGRLISDNPAADVYFNYTHATKFGFQVFKAVDLVDHHSSNNFSLAMLFKQFSLAPHVTMTPYVGVVLEQSHSMADHGSDLSSMLITSVKLTKRLTLEHTALFPNLVLERSYADWVNRFKLMYSHHHIDLTGWAWHNNRLLDASSYSTAGVSAYYSRIPLGERVQMAAGVTGLLVLATSDLNTCPRHNGVLLTIAVTRH